MSPRIRKLYSFPIDQELADGLKELKERLGISEAEQIRRAIKAWLEMNTDVVLFARQLASNKKLREEYVRASQPSASGKKESARKVDRKRASTRKRR